MFYDNYVKICKAHGVAPTRAALDAGLSKSTVTKWKTVPDSKPTGTAIAKLANYFGITISELLGEEPEKENSPSELTLTEGEKQLIELFRLIPEDQQRHFLEMGRAFANSLRKG